MVEHLIQLQTVFFENACLDFDAAVSQDCDALARDERIAVQAAYKNPSYLLFYDYVCARRSLSMMAARFKSDVEVGSGRILFASEQRVSLRVILPVFFVIPFAYDTSVFYYDAPDHGIG